MYSESHIAHALIITVGITNVFDINKKKGPMLKFISTFITYALMLKETRKVIK